MLPIYTLEQLTLLKKSDKKLRLANEPVDPKDPELPHLCQLMFERMKEWNGIGLAAPQMGVNIRVAVVDIGKGEQYALINPEITFASRDENIMEEGCLNFPGEYYPIRRPKKVRIKFQNFQGETIKCKASGLLAKAFQHEIDHLNKTLIIDHEHENA
jgi:peptide deformylase